jgi:hypothetical protein
VLKDHLLIAWVGGTVEHIKVVNALGTSGWHRRLTLETAMIVTRFPIICLLKNFVLLVAMGKWVFLKRKRGKKKERALAASRTRGSRKWRLTLSVNLTT